MTKKARIVQLKITEFSKEGLGRGVWRPEGGIDHLVDVPFAVPGDEARVSLIKRRGGVYTSRLQEWVHQAENRIAPRCLHFGQCGGCRWQQIPYEEQLRQKENGIRRVLEPYIKENVALYPIIPCLPPWQYRNKMELTFSSDKAGSRYLGLILYGTRGHVFQMQECHLANPWIAEAVRAASQWWADSGLDAYHSGSDRGSLRTLTLREGMRTGDRMVMLTVSGNPDFAISQNQLKDFVSFMKNAIEPSQPESKLSIFLRIQQIAKGQKTQFFEMLLEGPDHIREIIHIKSAGNKDHALQFQISPTAFFQPNTRQAELLYSRAIELTQVSEEALVYDLYCGTGTLGICLATQVKEVIGIELSPESSLDARENVKVNHLSNVTIRTGDVGLLLQVLAEESKRRPEAVVVDPPRAGLDPKALHHILEIKAPKLTYVSCNPMTQAANLGELIKGGYRLKAIQPVDQFPQTVHVENIAILEMV